MKILEATYAGLETPFTKVKVKVDFNGTVKNGFFLFENDGRDFDVEGDITYEEVFAHVEDLYSDEAMALLEPALSEGTKAYEEQI